MNALTVRFMVVLGSAVFVAIVFVVAIFVPNLSTMGELDLKALELEEELLTQEKLQPGYHSMQAELAELKERLAQVKETGMILPKIDQLPALLTQLAVQHALEVSQIEPNFQSRATQLDQIEVNVVLSGSLVDFEKFISSVVPEPWYNRVSLLHLESAENRRIFTMKLILNFKSDLK